MLDPKKLEEIAKQIVDSIPPGVRNLAEELESKTKEVLQRKLSSMDFVSREEFDVQTQVLQRTREKLEQLESKVEAMLNNQEFKTEESSNDEPDDKQD